MRDSPLFPWTVNPSRFIAHPVEIPTNLVQRLRLEVEVPFDAKPAWPLVRRKLSEIEVAELGRATVAV